MEREDAKDLTLSVLLVAVVILLADCVWLHVKCSRQSDAMMEQSAAISAVSAKLELHMNPPPESTVVDMAKGSYERAKTATVEGYEKAKTATVKQYEKVKAAAAAGYQAVKEEYKKN